MLSKEKVFCNPVILKEVSDELGLPIATVKLMVDAQSGFVKSIMESDTFDSVRLPYLGIFKCKPKEVQMINMLRGMTPDQQREFKIAVRTKKIKLNHWEDELKLKKKNKKNGGATV